MTSGGLRLALALALASWGCNPAPRIPPPPDTGPELEAIQLQQQLRPAVRLSSAPQPETGWTLRERMDHYGVPGVVVAVIDDGEVRFVKAWGVTSAGSEDPVTPTTRFQAASISKALTATLVLRLADQGRLDLDAAVEPWAPGIDTTGVTPRRLLAHTAGLGVPSFEGYAAGSPLPDLDQILTGSPPARSEPITVEHEPGTVWRYSGGGYQVLHQLIERQTGDPFARVMADEILEPLAMSHSTFGPMDGELAATAAVGHDPQGQPLAGRWRHYPESAAAGLWTTAEDLCAWITDLQKAHAGKPSRRLRRATAGAMFEAHEPGGWGLGVLRGGVGQASWFGHLGGNVGYPSAALGFVSSGHGVVVLTNGQRGGGLIREIVTAVATIYDWPTFSGIARVAVEPGLAVDRLVGSWSVESIGAPLRIEPVDGELWAEFLGHRSRLYVGDDGSIFDLDQGWSFHVASDAGSDVDRLEVRLWPGYRFDAIRGE